MQRVCDASCAKKEIIKNGWFQWVKTTDHGREVLKWKSNMRIFFLFFGTPYESYTRVNEKMEDCLGKAQILEPMQS